MSKSFKNIKHGQSLVEFAILLPLLLIIIMFFFDMGRLVFYFTVLNNAARDGARYGAVRESPNSTTVVNEIAIIDTTRSHIYGLPDTVGVTVTKSTSARTLTVVTDYCYSPITPFVSTLLGSGCFPVNGEATMFIER